MDKMKLLRGFRRRRFAYILIDEAEAGYGGIQRDILIASSGRSGLKGGGWVTNRVMDDGDVMYIGTSIQASLCYLRRQWAARR